MSDIKENHAYEWVEEQVVWVLNNFTGTKY